MISLRLNRLWLSVLAVFFSAKFSFGSNFNVIYAINAGGDAHTDSHGICYLGDPLKGAVGTESDYGRQLLAINRVNKHDEILYQTERYHHDTFGYDIPVSGDGKYVLILKFCEVYFNGPNMKVFDVRLDRHTIISDLDIYALVGKGTAHDELIFFSISQGRLYLKENKSEIRGSKLKLEFVKGYKDNPKINAILLIKDYNGAILPRLPPLNNDHLTGTKGIDHVGDHYHSQSYSLSENDGPTVEIGDDSIMDDFLSVPADEFIKPSSISRKTSGPKQPNPYSLDDSSTMLPVFIAIGAFIPLLFCLCRL
ncbi:malectin-A [Anopheles maculipalpis]|uniref:malectin-A n=1 Tax=Anopheles maculipalpis TaxID=1496333 RepID=UPI002159102B|nr:malectin-A [Anopheles maculipalpis]